MSYTPLSYTSLGAIIKNTWRESQVNQKRAKDQLAELFLEPHHKPNRSQSSDDVAGKFAEMAKDPLPDLPRGWSQIVNGNIKISFTRFEKWEFESQRICTELSMEFANGERGTLHNQVLWSRSRSE